MTPKTITDKMVGVVSLIALALIGGCQSGIVGETYLSEDRKVLAFAHAYYGTIYIAAGNKVWPVCEGGSRFMLSPSGKQVLVERNHQMFLYDVSRRRGRTIDFPKQPATWLLDMALPDEPDHFCLVFSHDEGMYYTQFCWQWTGKEGWRQLSSDSTPFKWVWRGEEEYSLVGDPPPHMAHSFRSISFLPYKHGVFQLKPEGGKARRSVWLRDDGTIVELLRQNDVPLNLPLAVLSFPAICFSYRAALTWVRIAEPTRNSKTDLPLDISEAQFQEIVKQQRETGSYRHPREGGTTRPQN